MLLFVQNYALNSKDLCLLKSLKVGLIISCNKNVVALGDIQSIIPILVVGYFNFNLAHNLKTFKNYNLKNSPFLMIYMIYQAVIDHIAMNNDNVGCVKSMIRKCSAKNEDDDGLELLKVKEVRTIVEERERRSIREERIHDNLAVFKRQGQSCALPQTKPKNGSQVAHERICIRQTRMHVPQQNL